MINGLQYIQFPVFRNNEGTYFYLFATYKGYGFSLQITNADTDEVVFKKFLRTQDIDYCGNYIRKVARNNFGAFAV